MRRSGVRISSPAPLNSPVPYEAVWDFFFISMTYSQNVLWVPMVLTVYVYVLIVPIKGHDIRN